MSLIYNSRSMRCKFKTQSGGRCSRQTGAGRCWQHGGDAKSDRAKCERQSGNAINKFVIEAKKSRNLDEFEKIYQKYSDLMKKTKSSHSAQDVQACLQVLDDFTQKGRDFIKHKMQVVSRCGFYDEDNSDYCLAKSTMGACMHGKAESGDRMSDICEWFSRGRDKCCARYQPTTKKNKAKAKAGKKAPVKPLTPRPATTVRHLCGSNNPNHRYCLTKTNKTGCVTGKDTRPGNSGRQSDICRWNDRMDRCCAQPSKEERWY